MDKIRKLFGLDSIHSRYGNGNGSIVAVLDSGIYPHVDLIGNIKLFVDMVDNKMTPYDDSSHGTHVCGIIAGRGTANPKYAGVAPGCKLVVIKVLDHAGKGTKHNLVSGLRWVLSNHKRYNIHIVNISIGTEARSCADEQSELLLTVDELWNEGLTVIVSAGNNGPGYNTITSPGISRKVITVGTNDAMIRNGSISYSGRGPTPCDAMKPDVIAPGAGIVSCAPTLTGYARKSGTSMSTPMVSGAAALAFSNYPNLTNEEFKKILCLSSNDIGLDRFSQGCGYLNINKLLFLCGNPRI